MRYLQFVQTITFAMLVMATIVSKINRRQYWEIPRPRLGWFEVIFGDNRQSAYWKEHFRMCKETFLQLVELVTPRIFKHNTHLREAIPVYCLVAAGSRLKFSYHRCPFRCRKVNVCENNKGILSGLNRLSRNYIQFPVGSDETARAIALFQDDCRFPQAIGAVDGTHIEIIVPKEPFDYFDRHHGYSVIMQAVVGTNLKFLDTAIGYPDSMHDARVFQSTEIFMKGQNDEILIEPLAAINGTQGPTSCAWRWCIPPASLVNEALP